MSTIIIYSTMFVVFASIILYITYSFTLGVNYEVHKTMTLDKCIEYGYVDFETFKREFDKIEWKIKRYAPEGLAGNNSECFVSRIIINNKAMLLNNSFNYWKAEKYIKKHNESLRNTVKW